ncbi:hypothetical protein HanPSC8_Chr05g0188351 [Helianthus annuus]|nr:hypothetical protein HanPSC8_Chr05g0188351 [Helianthus annuus]
MMTVNVYLVYSPLFPASCLVIDCCQDNQNSPTKSILKRFGIINTKISHICKLCNCFIELASYVR